MMPQIFLCHASQDKQATRDLCERLLGEGYEVWFDERSLLPGHDWEFEIRKAVRKADVVITVLSTRSVDKIGYVQKEIRLALDAADERPEGSVFLIPLRLDAAPIPSRLAKWQWVDATNPDWFERLIRSLRAARVRSAPKEETTSHVDGEATPVVVELLGIEHRPANVRPGQCLQLDYRISLWSDDQVPVVLGASIVGRNGDEYFDASRDRSVALVPGVAVYRRQLLVPASAPPGNYRLICAVWYRRTGDRRLATLDNGFVVDVTSEDSRNAG